MHMGESLGSTAHSQRAALVFTGVVHVDTWTPLAPWPFGFNSHSDNRCGPSRSFPFRRAKGIFISSGTPPCGGPFPSSAAHQVSDGGAAVAAGCGGKGRRQGRAVAHGFSNMGHEEGVAGQLQHIQAVLLVIGQASANKGL